MNKFLIAVFLLAIGLFMGDAFALNAPAMQGSGNPDNWYIEVEFNGTAKQGSAGHGMVLEWDVDSDDNETLGYTVHLVDTDDAEITAGVVPAWNDYSMNLDALGRPLVDGDRFMMQIRGYHSAVVTDGTVTEGASIEADAGTFGVKDGDGLGFGFKADASDSSNYTAIGSNVTYAPCWIDFDKGTN